MVQLTSPHRSPIMALFSQASDLQTGETIWVASNVRHGGQQSNSHTWKDRDFDGLTAVQIADIATSYKGWQGPGHQHYCLSDRQTTWIA